MTKVKKIDKDLYKIYLDKADEFLNIMKYAQSRNLWAAAGLNGIHCAISACEQNM